MATGFAYVDSSLESYSVSKANYNQRKIIVANKPKNEKALFTHTVQKGSRAGRVW